MIATADMLPPPVTFEGDLAVVTFDRFDLAAYGRFLDCKRLPESEVRFLEESNLWRITTPIRFAHLLGVEPPAGFRGAASPLAAYLFDYQRHAIEQALEAKRYAWFWDCGLGKTSFLEWARQVVARTGGKVLILTLPNLIEETRGMAREWYGGGLPLRRIDTREELVRWCRSSGAEIGITNFHKLIEGRLPEFRHLAGIVADESSILKTGGGKIKWNLIHSARGVEYKLSCTATPAPNEAMEYASQAAFLETIKTEADILWTFFSKDKAGEWYVKPHAREAFYGFLATWSMYLRDPAVYGFRDNLRRVPEPHYHNHAIPATGDQLRLLERLGVRSSADLLAAGGKGAGIVESSALAQAARGFVYEGPRGARRATPFDSLKPAFAADVARMEVAAGRQTIIWTAFDEESRILERALADGGGRLRVAAVHGRTLKDAREPLIDRFRAGQADVLVTSPAMLGFGRNFQNARAHVYSGFDFSYERLYQAVRRSYRYGQTDHLQVHFPYVTELEGGMLDILMDKARGFEADAQEQQRFYARAMGIAA